MSIVVREQLGTNPISDDILKPLLKLKEYQDMTVLYERLYRHELEELSQYYTSRQFIFIKATLIRLIQTIDLVSFSVGGMLPIHNYFFRLRKQLSKKVGDLGISLKQWIEQKNIIYTDNHYIVGLKSKCYATNSYLYLKEGINKIYTKHLLDKASDIRLIVAQERKMKIDEKILVVNKNLEKLEKKHYFSRSFFSASVAKKCFKTLIKGLDNENLGIEVFTTVENKAKLKLEKICKFSHKLLDKDILESYAPTKLSYTGRVYQIDNYGTQGLPKQIKQRNLRAMRKVWGYENVINYDMPSAQLNALLDIADQVELELPHLNEYVNNPNIKNEIANKTGLDSRVIKLLVLSYVFGAKNRISEDSAHFEILRDFYGFYTNSIKESYEKFKEVTKDLVMDIRKFLINSINIAKLIGTINGNKANNKVVEVDLELLCDDLGNLSKSKVTAFLLQGKEQEFILEVMFLLDQRNIDILSYEFDGLVVQGEIPQDILDLARTKINFKRADLVTKNFCDESLEVV